MIGYRHIEAIITKREVGRIGIGYGIIDVAIKSRGDVNGGYYRCLAQVMGEMGFGGKMQDFFVVYIDIGMGDVEDEAFAVFAGAMGTDYIFSESGDDVVAIDGVLDIGGGIFGDEFFVGCVTKVANESFAAVFGIGQPMILSAPE
jgi:hypothetical protein